MIKKVNAVLISSHDDFKITTKLKNNHPKELPENELNKTSINKDIKKLI